MSASSFAVNVKDISTSSNANLFQERLKQIKGVFKTWIDIETKKA